MELHEFKWLTCYKFGARKAYWSVGRRMTGTGGPLLTVLQSLLMTDWAADASRRTDSSAAMAIVSWYWRLLYSLSARKYLQKKTVLCHTNKCQKLGCDIFLWSKTSIFIYFDLPILSLNLRRNLHKLYKIWIVSEVNKNWRFGQKICLCPHHVIWSL